jgi:hypothetical protein
VIDSPLDRRRLGLVLGIGFALRVFVSALAPVPAEDAANYLWMAERFAAGDPAAALSEVFPPLLPLLTAPWIALGLDPFRAGQLVTALAGALSIWPAARLAELAAPRRGFAVALMLAFAPLVVRLGAQVYSEPVFHLFGAASLLAMLRRRFVVAGLAAGAAFWLRPEALALGLGMLAVDRRRGLLGLLPLGAAVSGLAAWRAAQGLGFELLPKLWFNNARGDGAWTEDGIAPLRLFEHLLALPGIWLEAFQLFGLLALAGIWIGRRDRRLRPHLWILGLGVLAILLFLPRRRFLCSWIFVLGPFAARALDALPERGRGPTLLVVVLTGLLGGLRLGEYDRIGERQVGVYLRTWLEAGERVDGDMTRVIWFAGSRPLPPKRFSVDELVERARAPGVRFVVLGARRPQAEPVRRALGEDFATFALPEVERRAAEQRGILVLERRR